MVWTPPRTWVAGESPTAAVMNQHIRDNLKAIGDPWTDYTPVWTASTTNPVIGNGTISGSYLNAGNLVMFWINVVMGSTTTYGSGSYSLSLPPVSEAAMRWSWSGIARDSTISYPLIGERDVAGAMKLITHPTTAGNQYRSVTPTVPFTWAVGDSMMISGVYEAA